MDALTKAALLGTIRTRETPFDADSPITALVTAVADGDREWALLLQAGARAVYQAAGMIPHRRTAPLPDPAPDDDQPLCSPQAAALLDLLAREGQGPLTYDELLPEALQRLIDQGLRVPPEILPNLLSKRLDVGLRPLVRQVIGARGRWLAQFNTAWKWATPTPLADAALLPDADTIWLEGTPAQRNELLQRMRAVDAVRAREWIADAWKKERAETRAQMIQALAIDLTLADEPMLELALDDRVQAVQQQAAHLLLQLPESALSQRMIARADALLDWHDQALTITLPHTIEPDASWKRDALPDKPAQGVSHVDWLLQTTIMRVPLSHWDTRFGVAPAALVAAAAQTDRATALISGWTQAVWMEPRADWIAALWAWWQAAQAEAASVGMLRTMLQHLPSDLAEQYIQANMQQTETTQDVRWVALLDDLPRPWSASFAQTYLAVVFDWLERGEGLTVPRRQMLETLNVAALALPHAAFDLALAASPLPDLSTVPAAQQWEAVRWQRNWDVFTQTISLRHRIQKEIH